MIVEGEGVLVHSKAKTGRYIVQAMAEMLKNIDAATKVTNPKLWCPNSYFKNDYKVKLSD